MANIEYYDNRLYSNKLRESETISYSINQCRASIVESEPILNPHCVNVSCLLQRSSGAGEVEKHHHTKKITFILDILNKKQKQTLLFFNTYILWKIT